MEELEDDEFKEAVRYIGKNANYIKRLFIEEMNEAKGKTMMVLTDRAKKDEKGRVVATTRLKHYINTMKVARKIAKRHLQR